jgi:endonuclease VIII
MPEGDTIFRTASVLRRALVGGVVRRALAQPGPGLSRVPRLDRLVGQTVRTVESRGKHLLIGFSGGAWLRTHMRMKGSWHRYRPGESWRLPFARVSCLLETDTAVAVCFDAPVVELLTDAELARHSGLRALGPDLLAPAPDVSEAVRRLHARPAVQLGEALLDQHALAGVGNVIKSEACFMQRLDPWAPVSTFSDVELAAVVDRAANLLAANTGGGARVTTGQHGRGRELWVYRRAGRPCRRCGTPIQARRQGEQARTTYWCPSCQPAREPPAP